MRFGIPLGRLAGIPVAAHWSVLVVLAVLTDLLATDVLPAAAGHQSVVAYWTVATVTALAFLICLLCHELAHALVARRNGLRVNRITLWLLGGVSELDAQPATARAEGRIAVVGPLASALLGGVFLGAAALLARLPGATLATTALVWLAVVNMLLGLFNLLPGAPLDGGRVLRAMVWRRTGDRARANRAATAGGQVIGWGLGLVGLAELLFAGTFDGLWFILLGWFIVDAAIAERFATPVTTALSRIALAAVMTPRPTTAPGWWTVDTLIDYIVREDLRHRAFPVLDFDGRPVGVIRLADLVAVPEDHRAAVRVQDVGRPLAEVSVVAPEQHLGTLRELPRRLDRGLVLVVEHERLVGVITAADVTRAIELAALTASSPDLPARH